MPQVAPNQVRHASRQLLHETQSRRPPDQAGGKGKPDAHDLGFFEQGVASMPILGSILDAAERAGQVPLDGVRRPIGNELRREEAPGGVDLQPCVDGLDGRHVGGRDRHDQEDLHI
jgi:hypothetical protein